MSRWPARSSPDPTRRRADIDARDFAATAKRLKKVGDALDEYAGLIRKRRDTGADDEC